MIYFVGSITFICVHLGMGDKAKTLPVVTNWFGSQVLPGLTHIAQFGVGLICSDIKKKKKKKKKSPALVEKFCYTF